MLIVSGLLNENNDDFLIYDNSKELIDWIRTGDVINFLIVEPVLIFSPLKLRLFFNLL